MPLLGTPKKMIILIEFRMKFSTAPLLAIWIRACLKSMPPKLCAMMITGFASKASRPMDFSLAMNEEARSSMV